MSIASRLLPMALKQETDETGMVAQAVDPAQPAALRPPAVAVRQRMHAPPPRAASFLAERVPVPFDTVGSSS